MKIVDTKDIFESNPVKFLIEVVDSVHNNWKIINSNAGYPSQHNGFEIRLFKGMSIEVPHLTCESVEIREYNVMEFLLKVQEAAANGFTLDIQSVYWDSFGVKVAKMVNPHHTEEKFYTKEELEALDWLELKKVMKLYEIQGRQRSVIYSKILQAQEKSE